MRSGTTRHAWALTTFAVLTAAWLAPLLARMGTAVPGAGPGDNLMFVWNLWWARQPSDSFFVCPLLFFPFGADLTLHTHTALPALLSAWLLPFISVIAAQNVWILLHVFLNFAAAYALAYQQTGCVPGAVLAGVVFGTSPYVAAHLRGHFNLIAAWPLPLAALLAGGALAHGSLRRAAALGFTVGLVAYLDYYLFIYGALLVGALAMAACTDARWTRPVSPRPRWQRLTVGVGLVLLAGDLAAIAWVLLSGGGIIALGAARVSMRGVDNPITFAWLLVLALGASWIVPRLSLRLDRQSIWRQGRVLAVSAAVALVALSPLIVRGAALWARGDYVSQTYFWRSAPAGIDAATLVVPNPYGRLLGASVQAAYARHGIDPVEAVGWIGFGVTILAAIGLRRSARRDLVHRWTWIGALFGLWALGPSLVVFGHDTRLLLPAIVVRFIPIVANARIPGRAMVVVYLAVAVMAAAGLAWLLAHRSRLRTAGFALASLVLIEYAPAPQPLYSVDRSVVDEALRTAPGTGAVVELPMGLRDGFGEIGMFDERVLLQQSIHGRPIAGGFVARLPRDMAPRYFALPVVGDLLRLSMDPSVRVRPPADAARALRALGIRFVVIDRTAAPASLTAYALAIERLRPVAADARRTAFEVVP